MSGQSGQDAETKPAKQTRLSGIDLGSVCSADYTHNVLRFQYVIVGETHAVSSVDAIQHLLSDFCVNLQGKFFESRPIRNKIRVRKNISA